MQTQQRSQPLWKRLFLEHPESLGETYWEHCFNALAISARLFVAALVCVIHALLPFLFKTTGSDMIARMYCICADRRCDLPREP